MTIKAFHAQRPEYKSRAGGVYMASEAIGRKMLADEREPASLVDLGNIVHDPGSRGMTS